MSFRYLYKYIQVLIKLILKFIERFYRPHGSVSPKNLWLFPKKGCCNLQDPPVSKNWSWSLLARSSAPHTKHTNYNDVQQQSTYSLYPLVRHILLFLFFNVFIICITVCVPSSLCRRSWREDLCTTSTMPNRQQRRSYQHWSYQLQLLSSPSIWIEILYIQSTSH